MFDEYRIIADELAKEKEIQYEKAPNVNGVSWYLIDELKASLNGDIDDYGYCAAFTTELEGKNVKLFKERCLVAINLVKKNSLIK